MLKKKTKKTTTYYASILSRIKEFDEPITLQGLFISYWAGLLCRD